MSKSPKSGNQREIRKSARIQEPGSPSIGEITVKREKTSKAAKTVKSARIQFSRNVFYQEL